MLRSSSLVWFLLWGLLASGGAWKSVSAESGEFDRLYPSAFAPGVADPEGAQRLLTEPGDELHGIDVALTSTGGGIAGEVRGVDDTGSIALAGVLVEVSVGSTRAQTYSGIDGTFSFTSLPAGSLLLRYSTDDASSSGRDFRALFHGLVGDSTSATRIPVENGETTELDPVVLPAAARIQGRVEDANGFARGDVELRLLDSEGGVIASHSPDGRGNFRFGGLAEGSYAIEAVPDSSSGLLAEFAGGSREAESADFFTATLGEDLEVPTIQLDSGGTLFGQIRTEGTNIGIPFTDVVLFERDGDREFRTRTNELGFYRFQGLPASTYLLFVPALRLYWPDQVNEEDARPISTTEGVFQEANMDGVLLAECELPPAAQGFITGNIDADPKRFESAILRAWSETDTVELMLEEPGFYTLECLPRGDYFVGLLPRGPLLPQYYPEASDLTDALLVSVAADSAEGIDFEPEEGISITGAVTDFEEGPIAGARVTLLDTDLQFVAGALTEEDGTYVLDLVPEGFGIAAGTHLLRVDSLRVAGPLVTPVLTSWIEARVEGASVEITAGLPRMDNGSLIISRRQGEAEPVVVHSANWAAAPSSAGSGHLFEYRWRDNPFGEGPWIYELEARIGKHRLVATSQLVESGARLSERIRVGPSPWTRNGALSILLERSSPAGAGGPASPDPQGERLVLYDATGRRRAQLVLALAPGGESATSHTLAWHPRDLWGREFPGGVYYLGWLNADGGFRARTRIVIRP